MKKRILVVLFALALSANLRAQVSIGELAEPATGALLDLNKAVKGGLALSNVKIEHLYEIPDNFPGITKPVSDQIKQEFTGAMVYHTGEYGIAAGIYVWNGTNWAPVKENCQPLSESNLTLTAPSLAKVNTEVSFSASANTSEICSGGETYSWSVTPAATVQSPSAANTSIKFTATGTYTVKVKVGNRYTDPVTTVPAEKEKTVTVTTDGSLPTNLLSNTYGLVGAACLDVKKSKQPANQSDAAFAARIDAFAGDNYAKTYKFVHGDSYSNLSLSYEDDPNAALIEQIIPPSVTGSGSGEATFTVKFKPNVKNLAPANGDSLTVKLLASYKDSGGIDKLSYLEIRVEDGTCVCPAKISTSQWLYFACHNLGGEDILSSSQLITRAHHGDWYRWGAPTASVQNLDATTDANPAGWNDESTSDATPPYTPYYQDSPTYGSGVDWIAANDPCPAGWRLPTNPEFAAAINKDASNGNLGTDNNTLAWPGTWSSSTSNFSALLKVGDYLYLPATGRRNNYNGSLDNRGSIAYYWSSSAQSFDGWCAGFASGNRLVGSTDRAFGFSVRCVAAE